MNDSIKLFGSMVFNDLVMRERLPRETYKSLKQTISKGKDLDIDVANIVANAMKDWAIEKGATHYTHWFQPMTGITAEKHDSFISPQPDGAVIMEFSGRELIKGESDASSLPSGGLRATFEARGYTAWDPTSYAFIKDGTLYIPTAFCSYGGEVLDKKTPLLKSMEALSKQAQRILALFGVTNVANVSASVGAEQEYFLIDKNLYSKRKDLIFSGRTLFGAKPPKGQELEDHYFGTIKTRVSAFMKELDDELWKLGIPSKTKHNEAAPSQHELAPIYETANIATDHNQLIMEYMKKVAQRHGLVCLLHEKPFAGINGSGKHNNWSMVTNKGTNLLEPGTSPHENAQFLLFICAVIKAVDEYQDMLRLSVASAGNDHRLGSNEAPPAIISMYIGEELTEIFEAIEKCTPYGGCKSKQQIIVGSHVLPPIPKDKTDRNRTSPFAFTGNKFEFRMVGSMLSIAGPNIVLNTIVAESLRQFADELERAENFTETLNELIKNTIKKHKRILFAGNNYSEEWRKEAESRGLSNYRTTADALPMFTNQKNIEVFERHAVFTRSEIESRYEILCEGYCKTLQIEALTMIDMVKKEILPSVLAYTKELTDTAVAKKSLCDSINCEVEIDLVIKISDLIKQLQERTTVLEAAVNVDCTFESSKNKIRYYRDNVFEAMNKLRNVADELEVIVAAKYWPFPTYGELLFNI